MAREAERVGAGARARLEELRERWEQEVQRLKLAEERIARLRQEVCRWLTSLTSFCFRIRKRSRLVLDFLLMEAF